MTLVCDDQPGIVHAISGAIVTARGNITESQQFSSDDTGRFFMRLQVETPASYEEFDRELAPVIKHYAMTAEIHTVDRPLRTLVLASRAGHCLSDLLVRQRDGHLNVTIPLVMSNHDALEPLAQFYGVPFVSQAISAPTDREAFEETLLELVTTHDIELVVLARYMQILSPRVCAALEGRIINIHHSFLPAFVGAAPYHQAFERGVKVIGATAHYVTAELDAGPIIAQDVIPVDHTFSAKQMAQAGRDVEKIVLAKAVRLVLEDRVFMHSGRTVVFS